MLTQKLYKNGNSIAVTIPKEYLETLNLKEGAEVVVNQEEDIIVITPKKKTKVKTTITPKFLDWLESFNKEYGPALKALAKR